MPAIRFGLRLPISGPLAGPDAVATVAQLAEDLGFDSIWVHDFIAWTRTLDRTHVSSGAIDIITDETEPVLLESLISLTYAMAHTRRIRVGTSIICVPYRQPVILAKQAATLDVLSKGRFIFGVGVGGIRKTNNRDFEVLGIPRTQKYERTREYVQAMREIWTRDEPSFQGQFVSLEPTSITPRPVQDPLPLWFGGKGPKSLDLAAEFGQGWLPTWLTASQYHEYLPRLADALARHGRTLDGFEVAKECYACIAETDEAADAISARTMETFAKGFTVNTTEGARASSLIGSPDRIRQSIREYVAAGVQHFEMKFIYRSIPELQTQLELFSREVIPAFADSHQLSGSAH